MFSLPVLFKLALRNILGHRRSSMAKLVTGFSSLGLVLGVALLLIVLAVMNGFERDMREKILAIVPHLTLHTVNSIDPDRNSVEPGRNSPEQAQTFKASMQETAQRLHRDLNAIKEQSGTRSATLFSEQDILVKHASNVLPALLYAVDPNQEMETNFGKTLGREHLYHLSNANNSGVVVLGEGLANVLGVEQNDYVRLLSFKKNSKSLLVLRAKVVSVLRTGTELDQRILLTDFRTLDELNQQITEARSIRVQVEDLFDIQSFTREFGPFLEGTYRYRTWKQSHGNLYEAIQMSRYLVILIVALILVISSFNLVATLFIVSADRQFDVAILKTLGAQQKEIVSIFALQGFILGLLGSATGLTIGYLFSFYLPGTVDMIETMIGSTMLNTEVYPLDYLPVQWNWDQSLGVVGAAVLLSLISSMFPAWKISTLDPASVLRHD